MADIVKRRKRIINEVCAGDRVSVEKTYFDRAVCFLTGDQQLVS